MMMYGHLCILDVVVFDFKPLYIFHLHLQSTITCTLLQAVILGVDAFLM